MNKKAQDIWFKMQAVRVEAPDVINKYEALCVAFASALSEDQGAIDQPADWLTRTEAEELLGCSYTTFTSLLTMGHIKETKTISNRVRYSRVELQGLINAGLVRPRRGK